MCDREIYCWGYRGKINYSCYKLENDLCLQETGPRRAEPITDKLCWKDQDLSVNFTNCSSPIQTCSQALPQGTHPSSWVILSFSVVHQSFDSYFLSLLPTDFFVLLSCILPLTNAPLLACISFVGRDAWSFWITFLVSGYSLPVLGSVRWQTREEYSSFSLSANLLRGWRTESHLSKQLTPASGER